MKLTRFTLAEKEQWRAALAAYSPEDDMYFHPEYLAASERIDDSQAECLLVEAGDSSLLLPYLKSEIPGRPGWFDVQGAYGYGGPLVKNADAAFLEAAWRTIESAWRESRVVAAFLRLHPLSGNYRWLGPRWIVRLDRATISIDLSAGSDAAFAGTRSKNHRKTVLRAQRLGYRAAKEPITEEHQATFIKEYYGSMTRLRADEFYYFPESYFRALFENLRDRLSLHVVRNDGDGNAATMMLFLWGQKWGHGLLSWRKAEVDNCTTNLIMQSGAIEAAGLGLVSVHLGGGRTPDSDDRLLEFKMRVGHLQTPYHTAGLVVCEDLYRELNAAWMERHPGHTPKWFLGYRQPAPPPLAGPSPRN